MIYKQSIIKYKIGPFQKEINGDGSPCVIVDLKKVPVLLYLVDKYRTEDERKNGRKKRYVYDYRDPYYMWNKIEKPRENWLSRYERIRDISEKIKYILTIEKNENIKKLALHTAVRKKSVTLVKLLLEHGVDPNCKISKYDRSPLFSLMKELKDFDYDIQKNEKRIQQIYQLLFQYGIDMNVKNEEGYSIVEAMFWNDMEKLAFGVFRGYEDKIPESMKKIFKERRLQHLF